MTMPSALTFEEPVVRNRASRLSPDQSSAPAARRLLTEPIRAELQLQGGTLVVESRQPEPAWLYPALSQLQYLTALGPNWDSYGGTPPTYNVLVGAFTILVHVSGSESPAPSIVPTSDGGVQLEWQGEVGELELRVGPGGRITGYRVDRVGGAESELEQASLADMKHIVEFAGGAR